MSEYLKKEDVDFEIAFYNGLIEKNPGFAEAFIALGELYTRAGMYKEGLLIDERLVQLKPDDPIAFYNLACSYSLLNDIDKAFRSFKKAVNNGYFDFDHVERDDDLSNLREDWRFRRYFSRIKSKNLSPSEE